MIEQLKNPSATERAMALIRQERERQDAKWGEQNHDPAMWINILGEEFGETCKEVLNMKFGKDRFQAGKDYKAEMIQVAAVACAAIEAFERDFTAQRMANEILPGDKKYYD